MPRKFGPYEPERLLLEELQRQIEELENDPRRNMDEIDRAHAREERFVNSMSEEEADKKGIGAEWRLAKHDIEQRRKKQEQSSGE